MIRELRFTPEALRNLHALETSPSKASTLKQVRKTLGFLETNPRHPSLKTHRFFSLSGPNGEEIFEAYAQNDTPGAYRVFFFHGPDRVEDRRGISVVTIIAITPHP